jgi:transposase-like protein
MDTSDQATVATPTRRLLRTNEEKRQIVAEAMVPGASVAAVARKHGVNANLLFGWRRLHKRGLLEQCREPASPAGGPAHIEIELPGDVRVRVHGRVEVDALSAVLAALRSSR